MADRSFRWWPQARRRSTALVLVAVLCLAAAVGWLATTTTGSRAAESAGHAAHPTAPTAPTVPSPSGGGSQRSVLQVNLCNSGIASCYTGRSVAQTAAIIADQRPDVVTLNEVCAADVSTLQARMSADHPGMMVAAAFAPARDRRLHGGPFRCRNGEQYGIGVLAAIGTPSYRTYRGVYPTQDRNDPEERVWVCIHAPGEFSACTTHLASTSASIAFAQCRYLMTTALPGMRDGSTDPVILGADLNLLPGRAPTPQSCVPAGYQRIDDGDRQDVVASPGITLGSRTIVDMHGTTDHPGLLVPFTRTN